MSECWICQGQRWQSRTLLLFVCNLTRYGVTTRYAVFVDHACQNLSELLNTAALSISNQRICCQQSQISSCHHPRRHQHCSLRHSSRCCSRRQFQCLRFRVLRQRPTVRFTRTRHPGILPHHLHLFIICKTTVVGPSQILLCMPPP